MADFSEKKPYWRPYDVFKRLLDILISMTGIIILFLPCLIVAIIIKCESKGPVLFKQKRVGKGKKLFNIYKFRTMRQDAPHDTATHLLDRAKSYITPFGGFMRKTSIDEIPQLINIFKGDMSFVGPRPALWNQDDLVAERDKYGANDILPGLTGWAQINGRDDISIEKKAELDGEYVRRRSLGFDIRIFFSTFIAALSGKNVTDSEDKPLADGKKRILVVCQYFYPEPFRINDICKELAAEGHSVTVLTGTPNYPGGRIYDGYEKGKMSHEIKDGIEIYRTKLIPRKNGKSLQLVLNYYSFMINGKRKAAKLAKEKKFDLVYVYQLSPALMAFPGIKVAKKQKIPLMLYILDLWPDSVSEAGRVRNRLILGHLERQMKGIYDFSSKILISSESFREKLKERKVSEDKIVFWPQYPEDFYKPENADEKDRYPGFNFIFTGNVGKTQGLEILVEAAEYLKEYKDIHWIVVGDGRGKSHLEDLVKEKGLSEQIILKHRIPAEEVSSELAKADVALLVLKDLTLSNMTLPAKLQSYLACGMPVLASINGEGAKEVEKSKAGLVSPAGDAKALAENALRLRNTDKETLRKMGEAGYEYCRRAYSKERLMTELESMFEEITRKGDENK